MALIDSVPTSHVTVPSYLVGKSNGKLDLAILRSPDGSTSLYKMMFLPVSYAMQALHLGSKTITDRTTGRYRTYDQQVGLFLSRYVTYNTGSSSKTWNGVTYWKIPGVAMAATPGTSNHGLGLADDVAEDVTVDGIVDSMSDNQLTWMRDNAGKYGFGLESRSERWHWHWIGNNALSQLVVDTLYTAGVTIPDLSKYGFTVPKPGGGTTPVPPAPVDPSTVWTAVPSPAQATADPVWLQAVLDEHGWVSVGAAQTVLGITSDGVYIQSTAQAIVDWNATHNRIPAPVPPTGAVLTPPGSPSMTTGATNASTVVAGWPNGRVSTLQAILGGITVDGLFGSQTFNKLKVVQTDGGLAADGIYGVQTAAKFLEWRKV